MCPAAVAVSEKFVSLEGKRSDWGVFCSRSSTRLISWPEKERENGLVPLVVHGRNFPQILAIATQFS